MKKYEWNDDGWENFPGAEWGHAWLSRGHRTTISALFSFCLSLNSSARSSYSRPVIVISRMSFGFHFGDPWVSIWCHLSVTLVPPGWLLSDYLQIIPLWVAYSHFYYSYKYSFIASLLAFLWFLSISTSQAFSSFLLPQFFILCSVGSVRYLGIHFLLWWKVVALKSLRRRYEFTKRI